MVKKKNKCNENTFRNETESKYYFRKVKRIFILFFIACILGACHRSTCPAYSNGSTTGTEGSKGKSQQLFPEKVTKKKH